VSHGVLQIHGEKASRIEDAVTLITFIFPCMFDIFIVEEVKQTYLNVSGCAEIGVEHKFEVDC